MWCCREKGHPGVALWTADGWGLLVWPRLCLWERTPVCVARFPAHRVDTLGALFPDISFSGNFSWLSPVLRKRNFLEIRALEGKGVCEKPAGRERKTGHESHLQEQSMPEKTYCFVDGESRCGLWLTLQWKEKKWLRLLVKESKTQPWNLSAPSRAPAALLQLSQTWRHSAHCS